jgi:phage tail-like protein
MRVASGALYLDRVVEITTGLDAIVIVNAYPYDDQVDVPAADISGSHPLYLTIMRTDSADDLVVGSVTIIASIDYLSSGVPVHEDVTIYDGGSFDIDWATNSSITFVDTSGGTNYDECRLVLVRDTAFASLSSIALTVTAADDNSNTLSTSYAFTIEDLTQPEILSVMTYGLTKLRVKFNEAMEQGTNVLGDSLFIRDISGGIEISPPTIIASRNIFTSDDAGQFLCIAGAENELNNGIFTISSVDSATIVTLDSTTLIAEDLPLDASTVTISPYRVAGVPDTNLVNPYFEPIVTAATAITPDEIELTFHTDITQNRNYTFVTKLVIEDLNDNVLDSGSTPFAFTTETLNIPQRRIDANFNMLDMFPDANFDDDYTRDLERFLMCFDEVLQLLLVSIDTFPDIIDYNLVNPANLNALLADLGAPFTFTSSLDEAAKRRLASTLITAYKKKGVEVGMESFINSVLEIEVDIRAYNTWSGLWVLGTSGLGPYDASTNPNATILGPGASFLLYSFEVEVLSPERALTTEERRRLTEIIDWMKPAHTHFVRLIEPATIA